MVANEYGRFLRMFTRGRYAILAVYLIAPLLAPFSQELGVRVCVEPVRQARAVLERRNSRDARSLALVDSLAFQLALKVRSIYSQRSAS